MKLLFLLLLCFSSSVFADVSLPGTNTGVIDGVIQLYKASINDFSGKIIEQAKNLFWTLALLSLVWRFGNLAMRGGGLQDIFVGLVQFIVPTGFFYWLLINSVEFSDAIVTGIGMATGQSTGFNENLTPGGIIDLGVTVIKAAVNSFSIFGLNAIGESMLMVILSVIVLLSLALIALEVVILQISFWLLNFAGVFVMGFGGGDWTREIAINYFRTVLGFGMRYMAFIVLVGIGQRFLGTLMSAMDGAGTVDWGLMVAVMISTVILLGLVKTIPGLFAGLVVHKHYASNTGLGTLTGAAIGGGVAYNAIMSSVGGIGNDISAIRSGMQSFFSNNTSNNSSSDTSNTSTSQDTSRQNSNFSSAEQEAIERNPILNFDKNGDVQFTGTTNNKGNKQ